METLYYTPAQKRIVELQELYPQQGIGNIAGRIRFQKKYPLEMLYRAVQLFVKDVPVLRLQIDEQHRPYLAEFEAELKPWEGDAVPTPEQLSVWLQDTMWVPHNPLCGFMYCETETELELYIRVHHLQFDSYGVVLAIRRLLEILKCLDAGEAWDREPDMRFIGQMSTVHAASEKGIAWLRKKLPEKGWDGTLLKERKYGQTASVRKRYQIPEQLFGKMREAEAEKRCSLEIMLAAAAAIYFSKAAGTETFTFGRTLLNRRKQDMNLPGMMTNTLPVFLKPESTKSFWELCGEIKAYFYEMMRYSDLDMEAFQKETGVPGNLYDVMLTFRTMKYIPFLEGIEQQEIYNPYLELPLRIYADELEEELRVDLQYQTGCYEMREADAIFERLVTVLEQGMRDPKIADISVLSPEDLQLWEKVNDTGSPVIRKLIPEKISGWAEKDGKRRAFCYHDQTATYEQLEREACAVGRYLKDRGVKSGDLVGVCLNAPERIPAVFLGIWKCGAAFLPVSVRENEERIREIKGMCAFFVDDEAAGNMRAGRNEDEEVMPAGHKESKAEDGADAAPECGWPALRPEMAAYCLFTSGSTGKAKAAVISHGSLVCRLEWMESRYHCSESVLQKASCTFDVSMWEYFLPLSEGGCLYLTSGEEKRNPAALLEQMKQHQIRTVHFVPSLLAVWLRYAEEYGETLPALEHVFASGEALSPQLTKKFYDCFPGAKLHNLYGPTECTIDVTYYDCHRDDTAIPIGRPVAGTRIQILNTARQCMPPGVEGELSVSGVLVGEGYLGQKSEKFRRSAEGEKIYDTGDRAMLGFDGQIYYLGRKDNQCKINGMRVDLTQAESVISDFPGVLRAAVLYTRKQIVGFYMAEAPLAGLEQHLKRSLPFYSIPQQLIFCENIPLNQNGKIDRKYLNSLLDRVETDRISRPEGPEETMIWKVVSKKLGTELSVEENLFLAGVDSLMVMELVIELEKQGLMYTPEDFYENLTIRKLAAGGRKGYQWLIRGNSRSLVLAFPYAAGTAEDYRPVAEKLKHRRVDFCVARTADSLPELDSYEAVILLGYCTGCAHAMQAAERLQAEGKSFGGMVLCAAAPPSKRAAGKGAPWKKMKDADIGKVLDYLHGAPVNASGEVILQFRRDADQYYAYFSESHKKIKTEAILFFGERDALTFPSVFRWKCWKKYLDGRLECQILPGKGHFFLKGGSKKIAEAVLSLTDRRINS